MRRLLLGAFLAVGLSGPTVAQELFPLQAVPSSGACTPSGSPCPVGAMAPSGYHFDLDYDDEFTQDSAINTSIWNCGSGGCGQYALPPAGTGQIYLNSDGVNISSAASTPGCTSGLCASGLGSLIAPRFGVWEFSARYPRGYDGSGDGYHVDIYINDNQSSDRLGYAEQSLGETILGTSSSNVASMYYTSGGGNANFELNSPVRMSDAFHTFDIMWDGTGGGQGLFSNYLDGNQLILPNSYALGDWGHGGATIIMEEVNCFTSSQIYNGGNACSSSTAASGNPLTIQYFRHWNIVAN